MDSSSSTTTTTSSTKDKEPFKVRAELFAPTRLAPKAYALFRARSLVTDVIAHDSSSSSITGDSYPMELPRIGILGGGHIGSAVAMALLRHQYPSDKIAISMRQPKRTPKCEALLQSTTTTSPSHLAQFHSIAKHYDNARLSRESGVLVLCMPPSQLKSVAIQIKHALRVSEQPTLVISVLCGASRELLQKSIGSRLVTRAKVNVAKLKGREDPDPDPDGDLKDEDDGNARSADPVAGVGNGREGRGSFVEIVARELAREQEDVDSLLQVLTDLSLRLQGQQQQQQGESDGDGTAKIQGDATRHARHVLFGVLDHQEDESHHSTASNPDPNQSSTGRKQDREQLRLRPEREARGGEGGGDWRSTDWDELLTVAQHVMCARQDG